MARTRWGVLATAAALALTGCRSRHLPPTPIAYTVGPAYQAGGVWRYPREDFAYDRTGLATVYPANIASKKHLVADGESFDTGALAGAHPTLQLPAIARVTNLENGRQLLLRLNDRGPVDPGRLLALTPRAAQLLDMRSDPVRVRVEVQENLSRQLAESLHGGPHIDITAAPRGAVQEAALPPPPGVRQSAAAGPTVRLAQADGGAPAAAAIPLRLPEQITQGAAQPGTLWVEASQFSRAEFAERQRATLGGLDASIEQTRIGRQTTYRVRIGPLSSVAQADAVLSQAIKAGVTDARIEIE